VLRFSAGRFSSFLSCARWLPDWAHVGVCAWPWQHSEGATMSAYVSDISNSGRRCMSIYTTIPQCKLSLLLLLLSARGRDFSQLRIIWMPTTSNRLIFLVLVRIDLPPLGPKVFGLCSRALIGGTQPDIVGGPPSHSAIKGRWGRGSRYEVYRAASHPTDILTLIRSKRGALPATGSSTDAGNATRRHCTGHLHLQRVHGAGERPQHRHLQRIGYSYSVGWFATSTVSFSVSVLLHTLWIKISLFLL
jgi:hypothetical protein